MTMNVGHHHDGAECETAGCRFDDTRTAGAIVTVGVNERGLWFSGAAAPWLSEWDHAVFAACRPSRHMRQGMGGSRQLRAALTVPVPGHSSSPRPPSPNGRTWPSPRRRPATTTTSDSVRTACPDRTRASTPSGSPQRSPAGPFLDFLADALQRHETERRAETEGMAALVTDTPSTLVPARNGGD
ncbi:hypothetical protein [Streptomyces poonensis]|uniref:Uncharacterized protein n=1 Tax=Streptomyces poonensis TaxID=68255 RepID=A0A918Q2M6_9ACTN|nr:hypothetical protein [Streptomyces poonensis]GGZ30303.1 hypothetical protein GCM10010365_58530 [Streptomyces poonensis]